MAFYRGPKIVTDGLVMYYDTDNTKSYVGEPTTNMLYNSGATNLSTANDIYGRCVKTYMGDLTYKFVNNGTGSSTIRLYVNLSDLTNTFSYGCSIYYKELTIGTINFDWCDTTITGGVNSSSLTENRLYGMGTRSTYDGTFCFLDINLDSGASVILYGDQIEYKSHVTPFVAGTRSNTQGLLSLTTKTTLDLTSMSYDSNARLTFNGTSNYINVGNFNITSTPFTYEAVIKTDNISAGYGWVIGKVGYNMGLNRYANYLQFFLYDSTNTLIIAAGGSLDTSSYFHVVGVYNGINLLLYINGVLISTSGSIITPRVYNSINTYIGTPEGSTLFFQGQIPIVKIYNRELTTSEVLQNFNALKNRFGL